MRVAISGTYSTGKTTIALALSYVTGIPFSFAHTMREILPKSMPNKRLEECGGHELIELGVRRLENRIVNELPLGFNFISDGCSLNEWVYGAARIKAGLNPSEKNYLIYLKKLFERKKWKIFSDSVAAFGEIARKHAKSNYDIVIHLPIEFPMVLDGHRPVSERFRRLSDKMLLNTYDELNLDYRVIHGTIGERIEKILTVVQINPVMDIHKAIEKAKKDKTTRFDNIKLESPNIMQESLANENNHFNLF